MSDYIANLPRHFRIGLQLGVVVVMVFLILMGYVLRTAPRMARESEATLNAFYLRCQQHSYARAYQLLAPELKDSMSETEMADRFAQFEKTNGRIDTWQPAAGGSITFGGRVCLFPPFRRLHAPIDGSREKRDRPGHGRLSAPRAARGPMASAETELHALNG